MQAIMSIKKNNSWSDISFLTKIGTFVTFFWQILPGLKRKMACNQPIWFGSEIA